MSVNKYKHTFNDPLFSKNIDVEEDISIGGDLSIKSGTSNKKFTLRYNTSEDSLDIIYTE